MKKHFGKILSLALVCLMVVGLMGTTAFAVEGDEAAPAEAYLTKDLQAADGTTVPALTFNFTVKSISENGVAYTDETRPTDRTVSIAYAANEKGIKQAALFGGVTWERPGTYVFEVTEVQDNNTLTDASTETLTYSGAKYTVTAVVANGESGLYLKYVVAAVATPDTGSNAEEGSKVEVEPDPTGGNTFRFTNTYVKTIEIDPGEDDKDGGLEISKTVTGDLGDKAAYFSFSLTLTKPATSSATAAKAVIMDENGVVTNLAANGITGADADGYFTIPYGSAFTFNLKHGQSLVLTEVVAGTTYTASETDSKQHIASDSKTGGDIISDSAANSYAVTNDRSSTTPTGVLINNLPFIMLILVAAASFVAFIVAKRRRSTEEN